MINTSQEFKESGVAGVQEALKEYTQERVPLQWAMTNNLGNALRALGERKSGTPRLEEAVATYDPASRLRARAGGRERQN
jgi:hypothetical protein